MFAEVYPGGGGGKERTERKEGVKRERERKEGWGGQGREGTVRAFDLHGFCDTGVIFPPKIS